MNRLWIVLGLAACAVALGVMLVPGQLRAGLEGEWHHHGGPAQRPIDVFPDDPDWKGIPLSAHGLPSARDWVSVQDYDTVDFLADCTLEAQNKRQTCAALLLTQAKRFEFAFSSALAFLRNHGLDSPNVLGPVVTGANGNRAILLFMLDYPESRSSAMASLDPCDEEHNGFDASILMVNTAAGGTQSRYLETMPRADVDFVAIHELSHALQYDRYRDALGVDHSCGDDRSPYVPWYVEGSAQLVARRYLEHLGVDTVRQLDHFDTFFWGLRPYQLGVFWQGQDGDPIAYKTGPFFQHLSERYGTANGSPKLLDTLFPSDNYRPSIRRSDTLRWFDNLLQDRLGTPPIGPTMALAMADIASWPGTAHNDFPRSPPGWSRWTWLSEQFNCSARTWADGTFRAEFSAAFAAYGGQCVEFVIPPGEGKAELMVRIRGSDAAEADAMHLAVSDIVTGGASDAAESQTVFSCARTLDEEPGFGPRACLPVREGPTRAGGQHEVRWVVPVPLIEEEQRVRLMLTRAPTRQFGEGERASSRTPDGPDNAVSMTIAAGLKRTALMSQGRFSNGRGGAWRAVEIEPITRGFTAQDFNPFDFGDDDRSDPLSDLNAEIVSELAGGRGVVDPLQSFFFAGGDAEAMGKLPTLARGGAADLAALREEANDALSGDGTLLGFNVTQNRYTVDFGRLTLPMAQEEREMLAFVEAGANGGFAPVQLSLTDLEEGRRFSLGAVSFLGGFGNNVSEKSATLTVLERREDAVTVQIDIANGPFSGVSAVQTLPFLDHRVRQRDRVAVPTLMSRYYRDRWQSEVRALRGVAPAGLDGDPREGPTRVSPVSNLSGGAGSQRCGCTCQDFAGHVAASTPDRPSGEFLSCSAVCCGQFAACTLPATQTARALHDMCEW